MSTAEEVVGGRMVVAAAAWLESLDESQREHALGPAPSPADGATTADPASTVDRLTWFYTPTDHGGLTLSQQRPRQQGLAMRLVASGLSTAGYNTVAAIMGMENVLDRVEGFEVTWGRERGRDSGLFYLRIFGEPGDDGAWAWRFAGHHVSLNFTLAGGRVVATTPSFLGSDPAEAPLSGGGLLRPLGGPEDAARALLAGLTPSQRSVAVLHDRAVSDIVSGNRARVGDGDEMIHMQDLWRVPFTTPPLSDVIDAVDERAESQSGYGPSEHRALAITSRPKGLFAADLTRPQRDRLRGLIAAFHDRHPTELADSWAEFYAADTALDAVAFAWAGGGGRGAHHYFRIQGPRLLIEYDNTQRDGNHAHSVLRDLEADFGLDPLDQHLRGER